ncbi:MAG: stage III sporulation protein AB [Clostridia bacterium]|nr:stage III sporulation protein AB [Clostridia bacterium]
MGFRLLCCAVIITCATFIGLELRRSMLTRAESLAFFREYFRSVRSYILHTGMSLDDISDILGKAADSREFCRFLREETRHSSYSASFSAALGRWRSSLCLTEGDVQMLCSTAGNIGTSDTDHALDVLLLADEQLSELLNAAQSKALTDGRLYVVLSVSSGAVAALLLL